MTSIIKTILSKLTKYEWITTLLPGCLFVLMGQTFKVPFVGDTGAWSLVIGTIFWGYVSYATGETIIEWAVKMFCPFAPYDEYIEWSASDRETADMLVGNLNMFRSLSGMAFVMLLMPVTKWLLRWINSVEWCKGFGVENELLIVLAVYLFVIFVWSYVKQIKYIKGRISKFLATKSSAPLPTKP